MGNQNLQPSEIDRLIGGQGQIPQPLDLSTEQQLGVYAPQELGEIPPPIRFSFDERKAASAASFLLHLAGGKMRYLRLIKLLYFADRDSLDILGQPITGDRYVSMKHGPVLSEVYDLVKRVIFGRQVHGPWAESIEGFDRYSVQLKRGPELGPLSEAEREILEGVFARYRDRDSWRLRDESHDLPEWQDPGASSREILVEEILQVLGKSEAEIEQIRQRAAEKLHFDRIFGK
jgi:uncharacterized phage-associated protein